MRKLLVVMLALTLVAACGPTPTPEVVEKIVTPTPEPAAAVGNTLVVGFGGPAKEVLDPAVAFGTSTTIVHKATYDTLVTLGAGDISKIEPLLAEKWTISPDGTVYTFNLRKGVKFHTGNELTAEDVKWSWERAMGIKASPSFLLKGIKAIEAKDPYTLVVTLEAPDPAMLAKMTFGVFAALDSKALQAQGGVSGPDAKDKDTALKWFDENSAGTGPFILKRWVKGSEIVVEKNPNYWGGAVKLDRVIYKIIPQSATQKLALEGGDIDIATGLTAEQAIALADNPNVSIVSGRTTDLFFLLANKNPELTNGIMSNPKVVEAIRYALDYQGLKELAGGSAVIPPTIVPIGFFGAWDESKALKRDLAKAKQLLKDAGYPNGFEIDMEYPTKYQKSGVVCDLFAQKIQADLAEAGIKVTLKPGDIQEVQERYRVGEVGFIFWVWGVDYPDINDYLEFLPNGVVGKRAQWTDDRADEEIKKLRDQAAKETDPQKRVQIWDDIQKYMIEKGPFVAVVQPGKQVGVRNNIKGYVYNELWIVDPVLISKEQ